MSNNRVLSLERIKLVKIRIALGFESFQFSVGALAMSGNKINLKAEVNVS
jgi:hypothetical protein